MHHPRRLRFVTSHYAQLQGLRLLPLAFPFLVSAAWRNGQLAWVPGTQRHGSTYWFFLLLSIAVVFARILSRYYEERFGYVRPTGRLKAVLGTVGFLVVFLVAVSWQQTFHTPFSLPAIVIACAIGYLGVAGGEPRPHYLALAAMWCVFASLPSFGVAFAVRDVLLDQLTAVGFIVIGIGDHLMLRRTLQPVPHADAV